MEKERNKQKTKQNKTKTKKKKKQCERTEMREIKTRKKFLGVGEAYKAIFRLALGLTGRTDSSVFSAG